MTSPTTYNHRPDFMTRQYNSVRLSIEKSALALSPLSVQKIWLQRQLHRALMRPDLKKISAGLVENVLKNELVGFISPAILDGQLGKYALYREQWELPSKYFVFPGDWDIEPLKLEDNITYQTMKSLLAHVDNYKKCDAYKEASQTVAGGEKLKFNGRDFSDAGDVDKYFQNYADIAQSIKRDGFQSDLENLNDLIGVVLDRDGNFLHFRRGHHRLALARELGVEKIKVRILAIHPGFLVKVTQAPGNISEQLAAAVSSAFERACT